MTSKQDYPGSLCGKTAIVTGSGRGIGRGIVSALHARGAQVAVVDIDPATSAETATVLGDRTIAITADVSSSAAVKEMVEQVVDRFGGIDILVNNAGIDRAIPILDMSEEEWDRLMNINLKSVFLCTKAVLPSIIERGGGCVISTSSIVARQGAMNGGIHYAASKGAILAFTKTLARQMANKGIRANAIAPGVVDTDLIREHMPEDVREKVMSAIPVGRLAQTEEIGGLVAYLVSDEARYITGATFDINGGFWIG
ncbi:SDR family NAD(P)-dependent oxidoreductase [Qingshengfaniella alkalisoli]|uniref:3-oxoacyl-ACP reductase FabG n=1 Tax=Qingshengfaniella alkalisoli TaxID=2599296 RepID=A0A5B8ITE9_9RHOB|nr:3-oxoacyl-ACP reductase family protein [Qingshengfaniella alkalisoli]QDY68211.1 3-oxoacyl-ACP reductase FabG [Qingshengfaniella alkalisoli]